jgi:Uma2 family endonuclease
MKAALAVKQNAWTWQDYRSWPDSERWQIVGGEAYAMSPAPATRHQLLAGRLNRQWGNFLDGKPCEVYPAPTDLKLSETDIVQPDLMVVCDRNQVRPTHIEGPPSLVIEILSPSTEALDRGRKLDLYAASGVKEIWLVTPHPALIEIFMPERGMLHRACAFTRTQAFRSPSFPDLELDLEALFDLPLTPEERLDVVRESCPPPYAAQPNPAPSPS